MKKLNILIPILTGVSIVPTLTLVSCALTAGYFAEWKDTHLETEENTGLVNHMQFDFIFEYYKYWKGTDKPQGSFKICKNDVLADGVRFGEYTTTVYIGDTLEKIEKLSKDKWRFFNSDLRYIILDDQSLVNDLKSKTIKIRTKLTVDTGYEHENVFHVEGW